MLEITDHGAVREIRLARPPANALNPELVTALSDALQAAGREAKAVTVSGQPGMFSAGLDVPQLVQLDQEDMAAFWLAFQVLMKTIACMPVPTAFALNGHSPAGGIVLAIFGDFRVGTAGNFKTGFNEVRVGLVVPEVVQKAAARTIGQHQAERIMVAGEIMDSQKALEIGLFDELAETPDDCVARAIEWCQNHAALPGRAMKMTRSMTRADLHDVFADGKEMDVSDFIDAWFNEETQAGLQALVESLKKR